MVNYDKWANFHDSDDEEEEAKRIALEKEERRKREEHTIKVQKLAARREKEVAATKARLRRDQEDGNKKLTAGDVRSFLQDASMLRHQANVLWEQELVEQSAAPIDQIITQFEALFGSMEKLHKQGVASEHQLVEVHEAVEQAYVSKAKTLVLLASTATALSKEEEAYKLARKICDKVLLLNPDAMEALRTRADCSSRLGLYEAAVSDLNKVLVVIESELQVTQQQRRQRQLQGGGERGAGQGGARGRGGREEQEEEDEDDEVYEERLELYMRETLEMLAKNEDNMLVAEYDSGDPFLALTHGSRILKEGGDGSARRALLLLEKARQKLTTTTTTVTTKRTTNATTLSAEEKEKEEKARLLLAPRAVRLEAMALVVLRREEEAVNKLTRAVNCRHAVNSSSKEKVRGAWDSGELGLCYDMLGALWYKRGEMKRATDYFAEAVRLLMHAEEEGRRSTEPTCGEKEDSTSASDPVLELGADGFDLSATPPPPPSGRQQPSPRQEEQQQLVIQGVQAALGKALCNLGMGLLKCDNLGAADEALLEAQGYLQASVHRAAEAADKAAAEAGAGGPAVGDTAATGTSSSSSSSSLPSSPLPAAASATATLAAALRQKQEALLQALDSLTEVSAQQQRWQRAEGRAQAAVALARTVGDPRKLGMDLVSLGHIVIETQGLHEGYEHFEEAISVLSQEGEQEQLVIQQQEDNNQVSGPPGGARLLAVRTRLRVARHYTHAYSSWSSTSSSSRVTDVDRGVEMEEWRKRASNHYLAAAETLGKEREALQRELDTALATAADVEGGGRRGGHSRGGRIRGAGAAASGTAAGRRGMEQQQLVIQQQLEAVWEMEMSAWESYAMTVELNEHEEIRAWRRIITLQDMKPLASRDDAWLSKRAAVLHKLALACAQVGDNGTAEQALVDAINIHGSFHKPTPGHQAGKRDLLKYLAILHRKQGDLPRARQALKEAQKLFQGPVMDGDAEAQELNKLLGECRIDDVSRVHS